MAVDSIDDAERPFMTLQLDQVKLGAKRHIPSLHGALFASTGRARQRASRTCHARTMLALSSTSRSN
jgi:hypothetical protein